MPNRKKPRSRDTNVQPKRDGRSQPQTYVFIYPKENTEEEFEYGVAFILNILKRGKHPMPPRPREWEDGREIIKITEESYSDGTRKFISREETVYQKDERKGRTPRYRRKE